MAAKFPGNEHWRIKVNDYRVITPDKRRLPREGHSPAVDIKLVDHVYRRPLVAPVWRRLLMVPPGSFPGYMLLSTHPRFCRSRRVPIIACAGNRYTSPGLWKSWFGRRRAFRKQSTSTMCRSFTATHSLRPARIGAFPSNIAHVAAPVMADPMVLSRYSIAEQLLQTRDSRCQAEF